MGRRPKQKWTSEEEAALQAGVEKHGPGWWRVIRMDPEFRPVLSSRSNIGLKDKWRNLSPQKSKSKAVPARPIPISNPLSSSPTATSPIPPSTIPTATGYERNNPKYAAPILEALSILKDPNGTDLNAIYHFIEEKQRGLSSDFKSLVSFELAQLIEEEKIEKVSNGYSLKKASFAPMQRDLPLPTQPTQADQTANLLCDLANSYVIKIADAEVKLIKAAEALMEVVRLSKTAEEVDSFLQRAENIFEQWTTILHFQDHLLPSDGSFLKGSGISGWAFVGNNSSGCVLFVDYGTSRGRSAEDAELEAVESDKVCC